MIGETISHYTILSRLGAGGMGVVYEAEDTRLGRHVAIKFLPKELSADPEAVQRFTREARAIAALNHPHICTLHDIGTHANEHFMVMELLEGESLKSRIGHGPLPMESVLDLGVQLAHALDVAHAKGVVHRDIKPANLFVTTRGQLKVLDFGVAKLSHGFRAGKHDFDSTVAPSDQLTSMGTTLGTVAYMSPEQARGQEIDARSDLFSAGVVLFEMATGKQPFTGATLATIFEGILTKAPVRPSSIKSSIPASFDRIVQRALEKDRERRYQTAEELRADLKGRVVAAAPAARSRGKWVAVIGVPLVTAALVGGFFFYKSINTPALTEKDTVVLSAVMNRTGDGMFDDTLGEALGMQLRQSPFLKVVADQQVQATLRLMGRDPMAPVTPEVGRDLCQRTGGRALIGGAISALGTAYVVSLNAQECVTGNILAEEQSQANSKEEVLKTFGAAVSSLREKLGESLASVQRYDAKIEAATTPSLEALKAYSQGIRVRRTQGDFDSVPFFRRAIELDKDFALAYARLGTVYDNLGQTEEGRTMTTRAYELRDKVSEVERLYIEARYYTSVKPDLQKAIDAYRLTLATYPNDYTALTNSSLLLNQMGQPDEALRNLQQATRVAPDQPSAWQNLASAYLNLLRPNEAKQAAEASLKIAESASARSTLYQIAIYEGDQAAADRQVAAMRGRREEVDFIGARAFASQYLGRFAEADQLGKVFEEKLEQASRVDRIGEATMNLGINEALVGFADRARKRLDDLDDRDLLPANTSDEQLVLAALLGDAELAGKVLPTALAEAEKGASSPESSALTLRTLRAIAALAEGKAVDAIPLLEPVVFDSRHLQQVTIWSRTQYQIGHWAEATKGLQWLVDKTGVSASGPTIPGALAWLAHAQAELGRPAEAKKTYERLFKIWKDADPDVPLLIQAKAEYAKLSS